MADKKSVCSLLNVLKLSDEIANISQMATSVNNNSLELGLLIGLAIGTSSENFDEINKKLISIRKEDLLNKDKWIDEINFSK